MDCPPPTLALVKDRSKDDEGQSENRRDSGNFGIENVRLVLVSASELEEEGVEGEEIEDEVDVKVEVVPLPRKEGEDGSLETIELEDDDDEGDDETKKKQAFEFERCSECDEEGPQLRPVLEQCGHMKCRKCYIQSEDECMQCVKEKLDEKQKEAESESCANDILQPSAPLNYESDNEEHYQKSAHQNLLDLEFDTQDGAPSTVGIVSKKVLREYGFPVDDSSSESETEKDSDSQPQPPVETQPTPQNDDPLAPNPSTKRRAKQKWKRNVMKYTTHIVLLPPNMEDDEKTYLCKICEKEFTKKYSRQYHIFCDARNGKRPYVCEFCSEEFVSSSHHEHHVRSKHTQEKPYECPICCKRFIQRVKLNRHLRSHSPGSRPKRPAPKLDLFMCAYCNRRFNCLTNVKKHILTHTDVRPFSCKNCGKTFKDKFTLHNHELTHTSDRPFKCPDCNRGFAIAKDMKRHRTVHTNIAPFKCEYGQCGATFKRKDNMERHMRTTHQLPQDLVRDLGNAAKRRYEEAQQLEEDARQKEENKMPRELIDAVTEVIMRIEVEVASGNLSKSN